MRKIHIFLDVDIQEERITNLLDISHKHSLFEKHNIKMVGSTLRADMIIVLLNSRENLVNTKKKYIYDTNKPVLILERCDAVDTWCRDLDKIKNCVGVFKNRSFRDVTMNNSTNNIYGKTSYHKIAAMFDTSNFKFNNNDIGMDIIKKTRLTPISEDKLKLIQTVLWDFHSSIFSTKMTPMVYFRNNEIKSKKKYDVFCVNHDKGNDYVTKPRQKAKNIVNSLPSKYKTVTKKLNTKQYIKMLRTSKICVACWGYGEWVHMDGYALYGGIILIKPECDYVKMYPDLYRSHQTYIPCKPDFSDLEKIIIQVLENYDSYKGMLIRNREMMLKYTEKTTADIFWNKVLECHEKSNL